MPVKQLSLPDITFTVIAREEIVSPRDSYATGNTKKHSREADNFVRAVKAMVRDHGLLGWCDVEVRGTFGGLSASDYLGGCSYESEDDFRANSGYFDDMCNEVLRQLQEQVDSLYSLIHVV